MGKRLIHKYGSTSKGKYRTWCGKKASKRSVYAAKGKSATCPICKRLYQQAWGHD